uniref:Uncharacterized protein n=1 Tax=Aegilops tauschii subsp. strangulata TaxID=200361 RepID=A0A453MA58_AEGTS
QLEPAQDASPPYHRKHTAGSGTLQTPPPPNGPSVSTTPRPTKARRDQSNQREHYKRKGRSQKLYHHHHYFPRQRTTRGIVPAAPAAASLRSGDNREAMAKEGAGGGPDWNGLLKWSLAHGSDGTNPPRALRSVRPPAQIPSPKPTCPRVVRAPRTQLVARSASLLGPRLDSGDESGAGFRI